MGLDRIQAALDGHRTSLLDFVGRRELDDSHLLATALESANASNEELAGTNQRLESQLRAGRRRHWSARAFAVAAGGAFAVTASWLTLKPEVETPLNEKIAIASTIDSESPAESAVLKGLSSRLDEGCDSLEGGTIGVEFFEAGERTSNEALEVYTFSPDGDGDVDLRVDPVYYEEAVEAGLGYDDYGDVEAVFSGLIGSYCVR